MIEECSYCHQQFVNENLKTELKWVLAGYQKEHPHYAIIKCSQCNYTYIDYNTTANSRGVCKMVSTTCENEHPHYLIFECIYEGCDYTYVDKKITQDFEMKTNSDNYSLAHPHYLSSECDYDGCNYNELSNDTADWEWKDGVCSICGCARYVTYDVNQNNITITGLIDGDFSGELIIPSVLEEKPVEIIGFSAFNGNDNIHLLLIPETVNLIQDNVFENCNNLQTIFIQSEVAPHIEFNTFGNLSGELRIFVPIDALGYDLPEWEQYFIEYIYMEK